MNGKIKVLMKTLESHSPEFTRGKVKQQLLLSKLNQFNFSNDTEILNSSVDVITFDHFCLNLLIGAKAFLKLNLQISCNLYTGGPPLIRSPLVRIPLVRFLVLQVKNLY